MVKPPTPTSTSSSSSSPQPSHSSSTTHKYTGVRKRKWGKWVSEIRLPSSRERIWLGSFDTPKRAARAFDAAQFCLRGPSANFNFPHSLPDIPGGRNLTPLEIREAAKEFASNYNSEGEEEEGTVAEAVERLAIADDDNESGGGSHSSPSNSFSAVSDGTTVQFDTTTTTTMINNDTNDVGSFFHPLTSMDSGNYASEFGLFTGGEFPYYEAPHSPYLNFGNGGERREGDDDGDYSGAGGGDHWNNGSDQYQCSYLWNF